MESRKGWDLRAPELNIQPEADDGEQFLGTPSHHPRPLGPPRPAPLLTGFASHITVAKSSGDSLVEEASRGTEVVVFSQGARERRDGEATFTQAFLLSALSQARVFGLPNLPTSALSAGPAPPPGSSSLPCRSLPDSAGGS